MRSRMLRSPPCELATAAGEKPVPSSVTAMRSCSTEQTICSFTFFAPP
jgi:hypothetical protein